MISASTPLIEVLRHPAGGEVLRRLAPTVVGSHLLHTYQGRPVGLILATEGGLDETTRSRILGELAELGPRPAPPERMPTAAPSIGYEGEAVGYSSAVASHPTEGGVWERFEIRIAGPAHGNPFTDVELSARFTGPDDVAHDVLGFYDGGGRYAIRFLPPRAGRWRFETRSNARSLHGLTGSFGVSETGARGPVRVADRFHFAYANGERYLPIGTTSYAWIHQPAELQEKTLRTLADSAFTKLRMCLFPKSYTFNANEPERYPFARTAGGWDPERFDPEYWAQLEGRIDELDALGIEADLILFHSYDRWGFADMDPAADDLYLRYAVARLAGFRNVWWSLANEFDFLHKDAADWERWAGILQQWDAAGHLRSIHNAHEIYDHSRPWITHVSMQRRDIYRTAENVTEWRASWGKPVVVDECAYEGDIDQSWGNITGEELVRRFWEGAVRGGYVGHGETYLDPDDVLWWAKGGAFHGTSPERIAFLARITAEAPGGVLEPGDAEWDVPVASAGDEYLLYYFGFTRPSFRRFFLDPAITWAVDVIDTWNMTVETLPEPASGRFTVPLPARQYMAIRLRATETGQPVPRLNPRGPR